ncbi:DUF2141 domain-containing protein [Hyphococcus sp.]|uniref:DUF2141 domain-containing protein n=1 Tax=Hyphococcus sp. TaxID=2038636 RepID=UPI003D0C75A9
MKKDLLAWTLSGCVLSGSALAADEPSSPFRPLPVENAAEEKAAEALTLDLVITHLGEGEGPVRVSIETEDSWFVDDAEPFRTFTLPRTAENEVTLHVDDLPPGEYAIRVFHDEDGDNELNRRFYGPPKEPYGFSGAKTDRMLPKSFDYAKFHFDKPMAMTITLRG